MNAVDRPGEAPYLAAVQESGSRPNVAEDSRTGVFDSLSDRHRAWRVLSRLGLRAGQHAAFVVRDDHVFLLLMAALIGICSGASAGLLLMWIEKANELFHGAGTGGRWAVALTIGLPAVGGLLVGLLKLLAQRHGRSVSACPSAVMEAIAIDRGKLSSRNGLWLGLGTGLTIGSGGSVGHEGPTVVIGATVGSVISRFFGLRSRRHVAMLGAGSAGGLAAAFNAPLAGVIFTVEVVFGRSVGGNVGTMSVFAPLVVAAVSGTFVSHSIFGQRTEFAMPEAVLISPTDLLPIIFLAGLCGLVSPLLSHAVLWVQRLLKRFRVPYWVSPALGGLAVGVVAYLVSEELLGPGRHAIAELTRGEMPWRLALTLLVGKLMAAALTKGSGGMGGLFMPSLFMGACLGAVVHALVAEPFLGSASASVYALVGMGAFLGATLRAPLTPIVMLFELTHDYGTILPVMTACIVASFIAGRIDALSIYHHQLAWRGVDISSSQEAESEAMKRLRVSDVMRVPTVVAHRDDPVSDIAERADTAGMDCVYVLDEASGRVVGRLDFHKMTTALLRGKIDPAATVGSMMVAGNPHLLVPTDTLAGAMAAFARASRRTLAVVDDQGALCGTLEHGDVLDAYRRHVLERPDAGLLVHAGGGRDQEVELGAGVILERVLVGRRWAGKTLAELDLRGRSQVQVLEWSRGGEPRMIDPSVPLVEGDELALVGTRSALVESRWLI